MRSISVKTMKILDAAFGVAHVGCLNVYHNGSTQGYNVKAFSGGPFFGYLKDFEEDPILIPYIRDVQYIDKDSNAHVILHLADGEFIRFESSVGKFPLKDLLRFCKHYLTRLNFLKENMPGDGASLNDLIRAEWMNEKAAPSNKIVELPPQEETVEKALPRKTIVEKLQRAAKRRNDESLEIPQRHKRPKLKGVRTLSSKCRKRDTFTATKSMTCE